MLASTSWDRTLRLWDLRTMTELVEIPGYLSESSIGFSPDDRYVAALDGQNTAVLLELVGLTNVCTAFAPLLTNEQIQKSSSIDFSPDSRLIAKASTNHVQVFDAKKGLHLLTIPFQIPTQTGVRFLPDNKTLAVLSRRTGMTLHEFSYENHQFKLLSSHNQGQWLTYAFGSAPSSFTTSLCLTSDRETKGVVWDASTGKVLSTTNVSPNILDLALSPDKKWLVVAQRDAPLDILANPTGRKITELRDVRGGTVTFSPSGRWVAANGATKNILWNTSTWTQGPALPSEVEEKGSGVSFSFDEKYFAVSMLDQPVLLSLPSGEMLAVLKQQILPNSYGRLRFSPDGTLLASQGLDNSLVIWDLKELRKELQSLDLNW